MGVVILAEAPYGGEPLAFLAGPECNLPLGVYPLPMCGGFLADKFKGRCGSKRPIKGSAAWH